MVSSIPLVSRCLRSPRLMMEDCGEHLRMYFEVGGAGVANVWAFLVHSGLPWPDYSLEWTGWYQDIDPLMMGLIKVAKRLLTKDPRRSMLAHAGQVPPNPIGTLRRPQPILEMWEVDSRLCGRVRFRYHDELPEIDPLERIGLIVAENKEGEILRCERDRDLEFQRCNEFIKRGALVQRRGAFGFVADGDAADRFLLK